MPAPCAADASRKRRCMIIIGSPTAPERRRSSPPTNLGDGDAPTSPPPLEKMSQLTPKKQCSSGQASVANGAPVADATGKSQKRVCLLGRPAAPTSPPPLEKISQRTPKKQCSSGQASVANGATPRSHEETPAPVADATGKSKRRVCFIGSPAAAAPTSPPPLEKIRQLTPKKQCSSGQASRKKKKAVVLGAHTAGDSILAGQAQCKRVKAKGDTADSTKAGMSEPAQGCQDLTHSHPVPSAGAHIGLLIWPKYLSRFGGSKQWEVRKQRPPRVNGRHLEKGCRVFLVAAAGLPGLSSFRRPTYTVANHEKSIMAMIGIRPLQKISRHCARIINMIKNEAQRKQH